MYDITYLNMIPFRQFMTILKCADWEDYLYFTDLIGLPRLFSYKFILFQIIK